MKFKIGDVAVEPTLGICKIEGVKIMKVDGKEDIFYVFKAGNASVLIPKTQLEKSGIRKPMDEEDIKKIITLLRSPVTPIRQDARAQYISYREIMKSGDPTKIAKLLRNLFILEQTDDLKGKEREIMESARRFLVDEITFVKQAPKAKVTERLNSALKAMYKKKITKDRDKAKKDKDKKKKDKPVQEI